MRKDIQIVFQDPFSSLSPRMNIEEIISEGINVHYPDISKEMMEEKLRKVLDNVDLKYSETIEKYPHEFSEGKDKELQLQEH